MHLSHFQCQISPARQQARLWLRLIQLGQIVDGQGRQAAFVIFVQLCGRCGCDGFEPVESLAVLRIKLIRLARAAGLFGGRQNRPVTGAATQVAGESFVGLLAIMIARGVFLQGEQRHDKPRRAKTTL